MNRLSLAAATFLAAAPCALAAQPAPTSVTPPPPAVRDVEPEAAEIGRFAAATLKLHDLGSTDPEAMAEVITAAGLSVERYNEIAARMKTDAEFQARVNGALLAAQGAAESRGQATPTASPPTLPTSGPGAAVLNLLRQVCIPAVHNDRQIAKLASGFGLRRDRRSGAYIGPLERPPFTVSVRPRGQNPGVCELQLTYPMGATEEITKALHTWSALHRPEMKMVRSDIQVGADGVRRVTRSWDSGSNLPATAIVFVEQQKPDGSPLNSGWQTGLVLYSERVS